MIYKLDNIIQNFDWGSKTAFTEILAIDNPQKKAQAELWMGAHPQAPSRLADSTEAADLKQLIAGDPAGFLGRRAAERFNNRLPYLFKVLAAARPLSIQAHPTLEQARAGYAAENKAGLPIEAPNRNYKDDNHKPEIVYALTDYTAMCGFRPVSEIVRELEALAFRSLNPFVQGLRTDPGPASLARLYGAIMRLAGAEKDALLERAAAYCAGENRLRCQWVSRLRELYPGDLGAVSPLLLNIEKLKPGQALFLAAGELHAYLEGVGMELMANSNNVLRGGLTPKHVDLDELLSVLTFRAEKAVILKPKKEGKLNVFLTPASEFCFSALKLTDNELFSRVARGPEIFLALADDFTVEWKGGRAGGRKGDSFFIANGGDYQISGAGEYFLAGLPFKS